MKCIKCLFILAMLTVHLYAADYSITGFGAIGDGETINTQAIQKAIDRCAEHGGRVIIPQGRFVTGTLFMKSNVTLHLERNAFLLGSTRLPDYPETKVNFRFWGDTWTYRALIIAHNVENIAIEGKGCIDGQGAAFPLISQKKPDKYRNRPYLLWIADCKNIEVKDVELRNSGMWMQSYIRCEKLKIDGIRIFNHSNRNNDMMDIDGCKDVIITRVTGDSDDDGITLKSTCDRISENITISDCLLSSHCNALKFGTETTAGFRNVVISNCVIRKSSVTNVKSGAPEGICGLALEIVDGGKMENISIHNIVIDGPRVPLFVRLGNRARRHYTEAPLPPVGTMKNIILSNLTAIGSSSIGCAITGIPGRKIEGFTLSDSRFICVGGEKRAASDFKIEEHETLYPESNMFGTLPAYGLYVRHVKDLQLHGLSFELQNADSRPAIFCDDVENADIQQISTGQRQVNSLPVLPLPKAVITPEGANNYDKRYRTISFTWQGTDSLTYLPLIEELRQFTRLESIGKLTIACRVAGSAKTLKAFCKEHHLNEHYADSIGQEGYLMAKSDGQIRLIAQTPQGLFYGLQTAKQLIREGYAPSLLIADWPDYPQRVFFDDISRGPISNVAYIKKQIRDLSELKYNALTFYIEHVIQPRSYPDFAPANGKLSMEDVKEICEYARSYQIEVIGSFQCFGHFEKILSLPQYTHLGDTPSMIAPLNPEAQEFLKTVIGELADAFPSPYFNINCDETWDLEKGKSREYVQKIGADEFYARHIRFLYDILKTKNKKVMMWGDIIMKYPHLLAKLPKDITYLSWNYSGNNYDAWIAPFKDAKRNFFVCPGILNSNRLFPDLNMTRGNMRFITDGYKAGAQGVMYTSWDDSAFHSFASVMYGVALAAENCWNASRRTKTEDFERRYCQVRLSSDDTTFTQALNRLMGFSALGLTYEMNDRVFYEQFAPKPGKALNINTEELQKAEQVLDDVKQAMADIRVNRNLIDEKTLQYAVNQYDFIIRSRKAVYRTAGLYRQSCEAYAASATKARELLVLALKEINPLETRIAGLKNEYTELWLSENQSYFLDKGIDLYREKEKQLSRMQSVLVKAIDRIDRGMAPESAAKAGLEVKNINSNYFSCWLLCGVFANGDMEIDYLAATGGEKTATPLPGERFNVQENEYKWSRSTSANGFTMDFNSMFRSINNGVAYAGATLYSETEQTVKVLFGASGESRLFCNGQVIAHTQKENEFVADKYSIELRLQPGANRLLIKSRQLVNDWKFSFRIDGKVVKSHKQKYYL